MIDIFFNNIRPVFARDECGPEEGIENWDCFMPLLMVVRVLGRVATLISNGTLRRHLEVSQNSPVSFFMPENKFRYFSLPLVFCFCQTCTTEICMYGMAHGPNLVKHRFYKVLLE